MHTISSLSRTLSTLVLVTGFLASGCTYETTNNYAGDTDQEGDDCKETGKGSCAVGHAGRAGGAGASGNVGVGGAAGAAGGETAFGGFAGAMAAGTGGALSAGTGGSTAASGGAASGSGAGAANAAGGGGGASGTTGGLEPCGDAGSAGATAGQAGAAGSLTAPGCAVGETRCAGALLQACGAEGTWSAGAVSAGQCGAVCAPNATRCEGASVLVCTDAGTWPSAGSVVVGSCGVACTPGTNATCAQVHGAKGVCGAGSVTCDPTGHWTGCSVTPKPELCDAANNDEDCDGTNNELCVCITGDVDNQCPCGGTRICSGLAWGACTGGSPSKVYRRDADGDGWCNYAEASMGTCGAPGPGWRESSQCVGADVLDTNPYITSDASDYTIDGPTYSKVCCGGSETRIFMYGCELGYHGVGCEAIRVSGPSPGFWISGFAPDDPAARINGSCGVHYALNGLDGVTGFGRVTCRPDGL